MASLQVTCFLLVIILLGVVHGNSEIFITPSDNITCPAHPCVTLNEYAREFELYFMNNSIIVFLQGNHLLDIALHLQNVSNITFTVFNDKDYVYVVVGPSAHFMWTNSENIEINGIIFVINGGLDMEYNCSILLFQETISFLSNLTILGNNALQSTAVCLNDSSQITISFMNVSGVISFKAAAIYAVNSTVDFMGQNIFDSNAAINSGGAVVLDSCTVNVEGILSFINNSAGEYGGALIVIDSIHNVFGNISFINNSAVIHGGAVVLINSDYYIYGSAFFINNTVIVLQNYSVSSDIVGGGVFYCANSTILFNGYASFQLNYVSAPQDDNSRIQALGGAISAYTSRLIFKNTSDTIFIENNSTHLGGAISISEGSNLSMQRGAHSTFRKNFADGVGYGGGAIYGERNSTICCSGHGIVFEYNRGFSGGAIHTMSSSIEIIKILFIGNFACYGGAVGVIQSFAQVLSSNFINNSVSWFGGAMDIDDQSTVVIGGTNFVGSEAAVGGVLIVWDASNVTFYGENNFLNNNANFNKGGAIYASDSYLNFKGIQNFIRNTAHNGGAMTISGSSKLIFHELLQINFLENNALGYGGAIYFEDIVSISQCDESRYKDCFIELSSMYNVKLNFSYNSARKTGSVLYGGDLDMCNLLIGGSRDKCGNNNGEGYYAEHPINIFRNIIIIIHNELCQ